MMSIIYSTIVRLLHISVLVVINMRVKLAFHSRGLMHVLIAITDNGPSFECFRPTLPVSLDR